MLDVALIQSLVRKGVADDVVGEYGQLIVDECHHLSAHRFEQVARRAQAKFVTGLSATVTRKDGHHPIIFMQCGPVRYRVDAKAQAAARPFEHTVHVRPTGFRPAGAGGPDMRRRFPDLYDALLADETRNCLVCQDVLQAVQDGRASVVLTERNEHLGFLAARLSPSVPHMVVLRGGMGRKETDPGAWLLTRQAMADATTFDERAINRNFSYDAAAYREVHQNLQRLIAQGQLRPAMELSRELLAAGSAQAEMSDDGWMTDDIETCLQPVLTAVRQCDLPAAEVYAWCTAMIKSDRVGLICAQELRALRRQFGKSRSR